MKGNHDILQEHWYEEASIRLWKNDLVLNGIRFTHEHCETENEYVFCGHIHPGIVINGLGRQSLRFPCFYFSPQHCILPAFSKFTGMATMHPSASDTVYAIVENSVIKLQ